MCKILKKGIWAKSMGILNKRGIPSFLARLKATQPRFPLAKLSLEG